MKRTKFDRRIALVAFGIAFVSAAVVYAMEVVNEVKSIRNY